MFITDGSKSVRCDAAVRMPAKSGISRRNLGSREPGDGASQRACADRKPYFGELGGGLYDGADELSAFGQR